MSFYFQNFNDIQKFDKPSIAIVGFPPVLVLNIADHNIHIKDLLTGLKAFFGFHFSLNAQYLDECKQIWIFVQQHIFGVRTNFDAGYSNDTLANDLGFL